MRLGALRCGCQIDAFEPSPSTVVKLRSRLAADIRIHELALSDHDGMVAFFEIGDLAGTNSLSRALGGREILVRASTVDSFLATDPRGYVKYLKVDAEGWDLFVLRGAEETLAKGLIEVAQFEYNHRWLVTRTSLRDVFEFVRRLPYRVGKLVGSSIEFYDEYDPELDRFFEGNYVLLHMDSPLQSLGKTMAFDETKSPAVSRRAAARASLPGVR